MRVIAHRRNTVAELVATSTSHGVEIDVRSRKDILILQHDPYVDGEELSAWLASYRHGTLILNVKEEGLEDKLLALMAQHGIKDFFFLDQSFPFLIRTARRGESRCAVRVSEFESIDTALSLSGLIQWVWVDCFTRFPLTKHQMMQLREAGFRLCLVSPELQQRTLEQEISSLKAQFAAWDHYPDAVCTKWPQRWLP